MFGVIAGSRHGVCVSRGACVLVQFQVRFRVVEDFATRVSDVEHLLVVDFQGALDGYVGEATEEGPVQIVLYRTEEDLADDGGNGRQEEGGAEDPRGRQMGVVICVGVGRLAADYSGPVTVHAVEEKKIVMSQ